MQEIDVGAYRLFYTRTGLGTFTYRLEERGTLRPGVRPRGGIHGEVTGLRGKSDVIRAHLTRIGREAIGAQGEPLRPGHHIMHVAGVGDDGIHLVTTDGANVVLPHARSKPRFGDRAAAAIVENRDRIFRQRRAADRPAHAFGQDASNRSELKRRANRTKTGRPPAATHTWSRRKAAR